MKKIYLTLLTSIITYSASQAQWIATGTTVLSTDTKVGIGTSTPNSKLEVFGTVTTGGYKANLDPAIANLNYLATSAQMLIGWNRSSGEGETDFISNQGAGGSGGFTFYNLSNAAVETSLLRIRGNGDIGIGTNDTKGYKLAIAGSAVAESITVKLRGIWPDYVFKADYHLPSLIEVKSFIDKNQHLPDLPSEQEVANNGINLGEMNKLLTKKIEELTLYLIEQNKQIQQQQRTNENLLNRVKQIEKHIKH